MSNQRRKFQSKNDNKNVKMTGDDNIFVCGMQRDKLYKYLFCVCFIESFVITNYL